MLIKVVTAIIYDLGYFFVIIIFVLLVVGFSAAFAVSMPDNAAFDDGLTSYLAMLGAFDIADYTNAESTAFFAIFLLPIVTLMLNLLVALMSDTFERVMESWVFESRKMRIETIIEQEVLMDDTQNAEYFPEYLQVLRPVEEASDKWAGVSGQISVVKRDVNKARVEQKVDAVDQKVDAMKAEMQANQELIMEQLRNMEQQKSDQ